MGQFGALWYGTVWSFVIELEAPKAATLLYLVRWLEEKRKVGQKCQMKEIKGRYFKLIKYWHN